MTLAHVEVAKNSNSAMGKIYNKLIELVFILERACSAQGLEKREKIQVAFPCKKFSQKSSQQNLLFRIYRVFRRFSVQSTERKVLGSNPHGCTNCIHKTQHTQYVVFLFFRKVHLCLILCRKFSQKFSQNLGINHRKVGATNVLVCFLLCWYICHLWSQCWHDQAAFVYICHSHPGSISLPNKCDAVNEGNRF